MLRDILKKSKQAKRFREDSGNAEDDEEAEEEEEDPIDRAGDLWLNHVNPSINLLKAKPGTHLICLLTIPFMSLLDLLSFSMSVLLKSNSLNLLCQMKLQTAEMFSLPLT